MAESGRSRDEGRLQRLVTLGLSNPFALDERARAEAAELLQALPVAQHLRRSLEAGERTQAVRLALAVGHLQACSHPTTPERVLGEDVLPRAVRGLLPGSRSELLRVVMAAGRCHRALSCLLGHSGAMAATRRAVWAACFGDSLHHALELKQVIRDHDVLLLGETGTGKEEVARAIQAGTPGGPDGEPASSGALNAAALPDTLVESELFGHARGAFTGATQTRTGRIRSADGGTFFLDEVGDLPLTTQVKLLRVIELDEVSPLGSDAVHEVDVRYVAATHKDLEEMVERGEFRQDLFQRLAGNILRLPPLRARPEDIPDIGLFFVRTYFPEGTPDARREAVERWLRSPAAQAYAWPGNVRELQNAIRNLLLGLPPTPSRTRVQAAPDLHRLPPTIRDCRATEAEVTDWYLRRVLAHTRGNLQAAARVLGLDRTTVRRRAREAGVPEEG